MREKLTKKPDHWQKRRRNQRIIFYWTHCWTQLWSLMSTSSGIMWENFHLIIQKQKKKKEENNALQPRAWLICRKKNETTSFSWKPQEKKNVHSLCVVVFACLTETCAFWLRLLRLFVFHQRGCWGVAGAGVGLYWCFRLARSWSEHVKPRCLCGEQFLPSLPSFCLYLTIF